MEDHIQVSLKFNHQFKEAKELSEAEQHLHRPQARAGRWRKARENPLLEKHRSRIQDSDRGQGRHIRRQKMPLHERGVHPRTHSQRSRDIHSNGAHGGHPARVHALHQEVQPLREAAQEPVRALLAVLPAECGRHRNGRAVPTTVEDEAIQRHSRGQAQGRRCGEGV